MSSTDSFIEEVTEEVRRDRLFALLKRWGWIGGVAVLLIVGGASFNEWQKAKDRRSAEAFGDQILAAIEANDQGQSLLAADRTTPEHAAIAGHLAAADALAASDANRAGEAFSVVTSAADAPAIYRELASFKQALTLEAPASERIAAFDALSAPGAAFRTLAEEQKALVLIETGETEAAIELLQSLLVDAEVTPGLQRRAAELIVAVGGDLTDG
ncbi:MAG: hypothetical protein HKP40_07100 [Litoreibacter sp.]|nr:hypothetical protein [Litoreibacter sp.]